MKVLKWLAWLAFYIVAGSLMEAYGVTEPTVYSFYGGFSAIVLVAWVFEWRPKPEENS